MIIISHRGNLNGPNKDTENSPSQLTLAAQKGFDVEADLWVVDDELFLGHDKPTYKVEYEFLESIGFMLWVHCKNLEAIKYMQDNNSDLNYFWHQNDDFALTSYNQVWTYPGKQTFSNSILVDLSENPQTNINALGICTDYPESLTSVKN
jgi:hypothetical protein